MIERPLGAGGVGAVYLCRSEVSGERKAVKLILPPHERLAERLRDRAVREAATLEQLDHPGIVKLREFGDDPARGLVYLVMDMVEGEELAPEHVRPNGTLDVALLRQLFDRILDALEYAHAKGCAHRDLKRSNVLVREADGQPVLVDWGSIYVGTDERLTQFDDSHALGRTDHYAPPEALMNPAGADPYKWDLYSLGVMLHTMLLGWDLPYPDEDDRQELLILKTTEALDPGEHVDSGLRALVIRATQPLPDRRPKTVAAFRRMLHGQIKPTIVPGASSYGNTSMPTGVTPIPDAGVVRPGATILPMDGMDEPVAAQVDHAPAVQAASTSAPVTQFLEDEPVAAPSPAALRQAPAARPAPAPVAAPDDDDLAYRRRGVPWIPVLGVIALLGVVGGAFAMLGGGKAPAPEVPDEVTPAAVAAPVEEEAVDEPVEEVVEEPERAAPARAPATTPPPRTPTARTPAPPPPAPEPEPEPEPEPAVAEVEPPPPAPSPPAVAAEPPATQRLRAMLEAPPGRMLRDVARDPVAVKQAVTDMASRAPTSEAQQVNKDAYRRLTAEMRTNLGDALTFVRTARDAGQLESFLSIPKQGQGAALPPQVLDEVAASVPTQVQTPKSVADCRRLVLFMDHLGRADMVARHGWILPACRACRDLKGPVGHCEGLDGF